MVVYFSELKNTFFLTFDKDSGPAIGDVNILLRL